MNRDVRAGRLGGDQDAAFDIFADAVELSKDFGEFNGGHSRCMETMRTTTEHSCLMLAEPGGSPVHIVVGCPAEEDEDLVVITVYRPDPLEWESDWQTRRRREE